MTGFVEASETEIIRELVFPVMRIAHDLPTRSTRVFLQGPLTSERDLQPLAFGQWIRLDDMAVGRIWQVGEGWITVKDEDWEPIASAGWAFLPLVARHMTRREQLRHQFRTWDEFTLPYHEVLRCSASSFAPRQAEP